MAKIQDIRYKTPRTNGTRPLSAIKYIARHHSATTGGNFDSFWKSWSAKGWGTGGYHEIILRDGTVQLCYDPHEITNGVGGHNTPTYHICVVGNGSFTREQERVFDERCRYNMARLNVPISRVLGHREFKGASTACPGINMDMVRSQLSGKDITHASTPAPHAAEIDYKQYLYGQTLMKGMGGAAVKRYQGDLQKLGYKLAADGIFGAGTRSVTIQFQKDHGLIADGYAGPSTQAAMTKALQKLNEPVDKKEEEKPMAERTTPLPSHVEGFNWAESKGLMNGQNPAGNVSREQLSTVLMRHHDMIMEEVKQMIHGSGRDVSETHRIAWEKAEEKGVLKGGRPSGVVFREQLATVLDRIGALD